MKNQAGFSLIEVTIVATLLSVIMAIVGSCFTTATQSLQTDDRIALAMESLQRSTIHISQMMRPCALTSVRVVATAADVTNGDATTVGEWMEPIVGDPRPSLQFRSATGELSMNAAALTDLRTIQVVLDSGEIDNDLDDDGDGMVDEGRVMLDYDGINVAMASNIEASTFTLAGRLLTIQLQSAARENNGRVHRFTAREVLYLRNN